MLLVHFACKQNRRTITPSEIAKGSRLQDKKLIPSTIPSDLGPNFDHFRGEMARNVEIGRNLVKVGDFLLQLETLLASSVPRLSLLNAEAWVHKNN